MCVIHVFTIKNLVNEKAKILTLLDKTGVVVCSKKVKEGQVGPWLKDYLAQHKLGIQQASLELMVSYVGTDLQRMAHEADKLVVNCPAGAEIGPEEVEKYVGISREYNIFEYQSNIGQFYFSILINEMIDITSFNYNASFNRASNTSFYHVLERSIGTTVRSKIRWSRNVIFFNKFSY